VLAEIPKPISSKSTSADLRNPPFFVETDGHRRSFGTEPSPENLQQGAVRLCRGAWHPKIWQKLL